MLLIEVVCFLFTFLIWDLSFCLLFFNDFDKSILFLCSNIILCMEAYGVIILQKPSIISVLLFDLRD